MFSVSAWARPGGSVVVPKPFSNPHQRYKVWPAYLYSSYFYYFRNIFWTEHTGCTDTMTYPLHTAGDAALSTQSYMGMCSCIAEQKPVYMYVSESREKATVSDFFSMLEPIKQSVVVVLISFFFSERRIEDHRPEEEYLQVIPGRVRGGGENRKHVHEEPVCGPGLRRGGQF